MSHPNDNPSATPETDEAAMQLHGKRLATGGWYVEAQLARRLERERNELQRKLEEAQNHDQDNE